MKLDAASNEASAEAEPERIVTLSERIGAIAGQKIAEINAVTSETRTLALNMIEIIDRNLYERPCDVRWWATNATVVDVLERTEPVIFFDWQPQAEAVVNGGRFSNDERERSRCLLLDASHRVIAASDGTELLSESFPLQSRNGRDGHYTAKDGAMVDFALTPGYETYRGLGWYGAIVQAAPATKKR